MILYNNSTVPAFNLRIEPPRGITYIGQLERINNVPPLEKVEIDAYQSVWISCRGRDAQKLRADTVPADLRGLSIIVHYEDEKAHEFATDLKFISNEV